MDKVAGAEISQMEAWSDPIGAELTIDGQPADKAALAAALQSGELQGIRFGAVVFRAEYPNANSVRFRDEDMPAFARSFGGQPFSAQSRHARYRQPRRDDPQRPLRRRGCG